MPAPGSFVWKVSSRNAARRLLGSMAEQLPLEERQGEPLIEDTLNQHDVLTAQGLIYVLGQSSPIESQTFFAWCWVHLP